MAKPPNEKNERLKRQFLEYRKYAKRLSDKSLDREIAALERFDVWNRRRDFAQFHIEWAMGFRDHLDSATGKKWPALGQIDPAGHIVQLTRIYPVVVTAKRVPQPDQGGGCRLFQPIAPRRGRGPRSPATPRAEHKTGQGRPCPHAKRYAA